MYEVLAAFALPVGYDASAVPPELQLVFLHLTPWTDLDPRGLEAALVLTIPAGFQGALPFLVPQWQLRVDIEGEFAAGAGVTIQPPASLQVVPPAGTLEGKAQVGVARLPIAPATAVSLLSIVGGSRLEAGEIGVNLVADLHWDSASNQAKADFGVEGDIKQGKLVITMDEADGFLKTLLAGFRVESDFDVDLAGRPERRRATSPGAAALEIRHPGAHVAGADRDRSRSTLRAALKGRRSIPMALTRDLKAALGPAPIAVGGPARAGRRSHLPGRPRRQPRAGGRRLHVQAADRCRPRSTSGVVAAAGYLYLDPDRGEYAGVLEFVALGLAVPQGDRADHHQDARRHDRLLAADHPHRRLRRRASNSASGSRSTASAACSGSTVRCCSSR